ncbi:hypothetical protein AB5N19_09150 [Seiridium cardinale]|uniref:Uncharacterized protein n=1 Tax=Seiridium cardinale TaxID=138064 RepID=A0ABR2Y767_9PEZI
MNQDGTTKPRESRPLPANAPDNPWLLFHPEAFDMSLPPYERFNMDRSNTHHFKSRRVADCLTARKLDGDRFLEAIATIDQCARLRLADSLKIPGGAVITVQDLLRDYAIIKYLPEFMVWLGHKQRERQNVRISAEQALLYRAIASTLSASMFHRRQYRLYLTNGGVAHTPGT